MYFFYLHFTITFGFLSFMLFIIISCCAFFASSYLMRSYFSYSTFFES